MATEGAPKRVPFGGLDQLGKQLNGVKTVETGLTTLHASQARRLFPDRTDLTPDEQAQVTARTQMLTHMILHGGIMIGKNGEMVAKKGINPLKDRLLQKLDNHRDDLPEGTDDVYGALGRAKQTVTVLERAIAIQDPVVGPTEDNIQAAKDRAAAARSARLAAIPPLQPTEYQLPLTKEAVAKANEMGKKPEKHKGLDPARSALILGIVTGTINTQDEIKAAVKGDLDDMGDKLVRTKIRSIVYTLSAKALAGDLNPDEQIIWNQVVEFTEADPENPRAALKAFESKFVAHYKSLGDPKNEPTGDTAEKGTASVNPTPEVSPTDRKAVIADVLRAYPLIVNGTATQEIQDLWRDVGRIVGVKNLDDPDAVLHGIKAYFGMLEDTAGTTPPPVETTTTVLSNDASLEADPAGPAALLKPGGVDFFLPSPLPGWHQSLSAPVGNAPQIVDQTPPPDVKPLTPQERRRDFVAEVVEHFSLFGDQIPYGAILRYSGMIPDRFRQIMGRSGINVSQRGPTEQLNRYHLREVVQFLYTLRYREEYNQMNDREKSALSRELAGLYRQGLVKQDRR